MPTISIIFQVQTLKATNKHTSQRNKQKLIEQTTVWQLPEGRKQGEVVKGKGGQIHVMGRDFTLDGKQLMQNTGDIELYTLNLCNF